MPHGVEGDVHRRFCKLNRRLMLNQRREEASACSPSFIVSCMESWNPPAPAIRKKSAQKSDDEPDCSPLDGDVDSDCCTDDEADSSTLSASPPNVPFASNVKFQSSKSKRPYNERGEKVAYVATKAIIKDENRASELDFARHKATARARLLVDMVNSDGQGDRHIHGRVLGNFAVKEVTSHDGEDVILERTLNTQESKKALTHGPFMCMVQPTWIRPKIKFLMDTGCRHDLISPRKVEKHDLETLVSQETVSFQTANGVINTDMVSNFQTESFKEPMNVHVLEDTPSKLSTGKRCIKQRYGFVWPPGLDSFMIDSDGERTPFRERRHSVHSSSGKFPWKKPEDLPVYLREEAENGEVPEIGDDHEIEVEGEGAKVRRAKVAALKNEAKSHTSLSQPIERSMHSCQDDALPN